jgi:hypothetical protein
LLLRYVLICGFYTALLLSGSHAWAQQTGKVFRVGVIYQGGPFNAVIEGLREGLKLLGSGERIYGRNSDRFCRRGDPPTRNR